MSLIGLVVAFGAGSSARAATTFEIRGGGNGHGIGMSQYGAYGYALHGEPYQFILAHYYEGTALGNTDPNQVVRVLLGTGKARFSGASAAGSQKLDPSLSYSVGSLPTGALALYSSAGKKIAKFPTTVTVTGTGPLDLAGHGEYRGALELSASGRSVQIVNAVGLDDYVRGVIGAEMPARWPLAALEAQAVAARTYAITVDVAGSGYQLYDDTRSQMYLGVAAETAATDAAVAATSGQIVTYQGNPVPTYFFSSSGGHTENIENVWIGVNPEPWLKGVPDPYDAAGGNPYYRWTERMPLATARRELGRRVKGKFRGIRVTKRGVSPRVVYAEVVGTGGTTRVTGTQLQSAFGLLSTYMRFTTISARRIRRVTVAHLAAQSWGLTTLGGAVFPAAPGATATVQVKRRNGWRTLARVHVDRGGAYRADVPDIGTYRIAYDGATGPTITFG